MLAQIARPYGRLKTDMLCVTWSTDSLIPRFTALIKGNKQGADFKSSWQFGEVSAWNVAVKVIVRLSQEGKMENKLHMQSLFLSFNMSNDINCAEAKSESLARIVYDTHKCALNKKTHSHTALHWLCSSAVVWHASASWSLGLKRF